MDESCDLTSVTVSPDGRFWWDRAQWRPVSDDGCWRWSGTRWLQMEATRFGQFVLRQLGDA